MIKFVCMMLMIPLFFSSRPANLPDCLLNATEFVATSDGREIVFESDDEIGKFNDLLAAIFDGATRVPALGVSLHDDTILARKEGIFVELFYSATQNCDGMPFDSLLFKVDKNASGVTLIRGNDGIYQGRCYYLNLKNNLDEIYNFLGSLPTREESEKSVELQIETFAEQPQIADNQTEQPKPRVIRQSTK